MLYYTHNEVTSTVKPVARAVASHSPECGSVLRTPESYSPKQFLIYSSV